MIILKSNKIKYINFLNINQKGFSLIEVLIALCLLGFILTGIFRLQLLGLKINHEAYLQSIAIQQLLSLAEVINTSNHGISAGLEHWKQDCRLILPKANGELKRISNENQINLTWYSVGSHLWKCDLPRKENFSCLSLKVLIK